jgi:hypothetical protein
MNRDELIQTLVERGGNSDALTAMTDGQLQMIDAMCNKQPGEGGIMAEGDMDNPQPAPDDEEGMKKLAEGLKRFMAYGQAKYGEKFDEAMKPDESSSVSSQAKPHTEEGGDVSGKNTKGQLAALGMGTENRSKYDSANHGERFSEKDVRRIVDAAVSQLKAEFAPIQKDVQTFKEETRREGLELFCETQLKIGRITPAEMERPNGKPNLIDFLMGLDATKVVAKFSEKGKTVSQTALDVAKDQILARPVFRFGEKVGTGPNGKNGQNPKPEEITDEEIAVIERGFAMYSEHLPGKHDPVTGKPWSAQMFIDGFKAAKKRDPTITPAKFSDIFAAA